MKNQHTALLHLSLLLSILLSLFPYPSQINHWMPYWPAMVIIYWGLSRSDHHILFYAFGYGLLLDTLNGSLLGKHGLSLVAIAFLVSKFNTQLKMISTWQLVMVIAALLINDFIIRSLIDWLAYTHPPDIKQTLPLLTAVVIWPWLKYIMDRIVISLRSSSNP